MNAQEYEVLSHLKELGLGAGKDAKFDVSQFDIDVIKSLELQRYIKTTPKRDMAGLTGLGLIAVTTAAEKRKRETGVSIYDTEDELAGLSDTQIAALQQLEIRGAADNWVEMNIHHITRKSLEKLGLIQYDGVRYLLLDAALEKLAEVGHVRTVEDNSNGALLKPEELPRRPLNLESRVSRVKPFVEAGLDNEDSLVVQETPIPQPLPHSNGEGEQCADDCDVCIHREVLDLIAEQYPNVGKLRDVYLQQKRLMKELGIKK